jgi:RNase P/RNase MRP subunit POP5
MKALIPSHKESKRYLLLKGEDLKKNTSKAIKEYIGILGLSETCPRWIEDKILCINRKTLDKVRASFCLSKKRIEVVKVSGTLKGLKK